MAQQQQGKANEDAYDRDGDQVLYQGLAVIVMEPMPQHGGCSFPDWREGRAA
jgi:hypothetical protein